MLEGFRAIARAHIQDNSESPILGSGYRPETLRKYQWSSSVRGRGLFSPVLAAPVCQPSTQSQPKSLLELQRQFIPITLTDDEAQKPLILSRCEFRHPMILAT